MKDTTVATEIEYKALDFTLIKRLLIYLKPYLKYVIFALSLAVLSTALMPALPYMIKIAIDNYIAKSDLNGLLYFTLGIFALLIINSFLRFGLTYLMQWVGQKVLYDIRIKVFGHIQSLSLKFFDKNPVGKLVTRVTNDIEVLNELFSSGVVMVIADFMLIFWIIGFMFFTNWRLALYTLSVMPFVFLATVIFRAKVRVVFREIRLKVSEMNTFLNEFISGIATVKLFTQEKQQNILFDDINKRHADLWLKSIFYYALFFPVVEMLSMTSFAIILWYSAGNIVSGMMTIGTLIAFANYSEMLFRPIRDLTEKYTTLQSAMAASERIFGLLDTDTHVEDAPDAAEMPPLKEGISIKDLLFAYDDKPVLRGVSFDVKKGETVAVVGATGAGKTTLINLLCRFYDFQEGEILIDGTDIRKLNQDSLRRRIALVMQDVFLFSRSVKDNISLNNESIGESKIYEAAQALGASAFIENLPDGFQNTLSERGSTLSSGQRQLIAFCRAFAYDPDILILDEATSNIDSETEQIIERSLIKLLDKRTSIVIAHRLSTIRRADRIVVIHKGKVRETGTHKELLELGGIYAKLYHIQFKAVVAEAI